MYNGNDILKKNARAALTGRYSTAIAALILIDLVSFVLSAVFQSSGIGMNRLLSVLAQLIILLLTWMLETGSLRLYLGFARGEEVRVTDLFWFAGNEPDRIILLWLTLLVRALIAAIPAIAVRVLVWYAADLYQLSAVAILLLRALSALLCLLCVLPALLRYALVFYLYTDDPSRSVAEDLEESRRLMEGNRMRYCKLLLSFLGLFLLSLLSCGIGLMWLIPYVTETKAQFYLALRREKAQEM